MATYVRLQATGICINSFNCSVHVVAWLIVIYSIHSML